MILASSSNTVFYIFTWHELKLELLMVWELISNVWRRMHAKQVLPPLNNRVLRFVSVGCVFYLNYVFISLGFEIIWEYWCNALKKLSYYAKIGHSYIIQYNFFNISMVSGSIIFYKFKLPLGSRWGLNIFLVNDHRGKLSVTKMYMLRWMHDKTCKDRIRNKRIREFLEIGPTEGTII